MGEYTYIQAPSLCQYADEGLIIEMGKTVFPGLVNREPKKNGLILCVSGDYRDRNNHLYAVNRFQILLGILRAWRPIAGERQDEINQGLGLLVRRDEIGNQALEIGGVIDYSIADKEIQVLSNKARIVIKKSKSVKNSFWLNGRRDRNSADYFMIYEYVKNELGGPNKVQTLLDISMKSISSFKKSANNLCPTFGGRHAGGNKEPCWNLQDQGKFISLLLCNWITHLSSIEKCSRGPLLSERSIPHSL